VPADGLLKTTPSGLENLSISGAGSMLSFEKKPPRQFVPPSSSKPEPPLTLHEGSAEFTKLPKRTTVKKSFAATVFSTSSTGQRTDVLRMRPR